MKATSPIVLTDSVLARFAAKVGPADENGCLPWLATKQYGYGRLMMGSVREGSTLRPRPILAHRIAYAIANGPIPDGALVDHICHNRACVNAEHLRLADHSMNGTNRSGPSSTSSTGIRGVFWNPRRGKWFAQPQINGRLYWLGCYTDPREAEAVVIAWRREHMPYSVLDQQVSA